MKKSNEDLINLSNHTSEGSHELLINQIRSFIKANSQDDRTFNRDILQLKRLRVRADYEDLMIDYEISEKSITLSKSTQKILNKCK